jgi:uncharacterized protein
MKYLVLLGVLLVVYLLWRSSQRRNAPRPPSPATSASAALPQDMVECPVCSVHLPRGDAVAGPSGRLYCSPEHRRLAGG